MVVRVANGRKFYCDAVVHNVINDIEIFIRRQNKNMSKCERKRIHRVAYDLVVSIFVDIQLNWEQENSVYMRFGSMKEAMKRFFLDVAKGLEDVDLMASRFEYFFLRHAYKAFESEVEALVMANIRTKRWVQSPKYVQGHMDLYLIEEVESKGIAEILQLIDNPVELKKLTTSRLIRLEVDIVLKHFTWKKFMSLLEKSLKNTYDSASVDVETKSKSFYLFHLFKSFQIFKSTYVADELRREMHALGWTELEEMSIQFELRHINAIVDKFAASFSSMDKNKIIDSVYLQLQDNCLFDAAFCTSCQEKCPLCRSFCFLELFHDGCHDCFHQPDGLTGWHYTGIQKLSHNACNTSPPDQTFTLDNDEECRYADFSKKFNTWLQPDRTQPISEYRQYLISRYNVEIAKYYSVNPSDAVDPAENLDVVTSKIKRRLDFYEDFPEQ
ncbi:hypothetical protein QYM36_016399 [Artemia franciscana]|uniref:Uncharacterized protein n=1 Tax=Artemia franciscana TaxID=6661 RepID=A0AA88KTP1_ARTSF|nr:hypothetical protein QYM36_016399 [Artemia franciscana]